MSARATTTAVPVQIDVPERATPEVVEVVQRLLPDLSSSAAIPGPEAVKRLVESESTRLIVARDGDQIVGILTLVVFQLPTGLRGRLEDLVIDEAARGRGISLAMMREGIRLAREAKVRTIDFTARPSRVAASRMYDRLEEMGFLRRDTHVYRYEVEPDEEQPPSSPQAVSR